MRLSAKLVSGGVAAAVIALSTPFIAGWEGKRNYAYLDALANPPVWTICYGSTNGVKKGDYKTDAECIELLRQEVAQYYSRIENCMTRNDIPVSVQASLLELAYNVGTTGVCNSTAMRKANAGDYIGACDAVTAWVKAGGKTIKGLVNRRNASKEMCLMDVL